MVRMNVIDKKEEEEGISAEERLERKMLLHEFWAILKCMNRSFVRRLDPSGLKKEIRIQNSFIH